MKEHAQVQLVELNPLPLPVADGIIIHRKIKILEFNPTLAAMFGYEPDGLTDEMTILNLMVPKPRSLVLKHTLIKYERFYNAVGLHKDGSTFSRPTRGRDLDPVANQ
jgi:PAS domain-containing protein